MTKDLEKDQNGWMKYNGGGDKAVGAGMGGVITGSVCVYRVVQKDVHS